MVGYCSGCWGCLFLMWMCIDVVWIMEFGLICIVRFDFNVWYNFFEVIEELDWWWDVW